MTSMSTEIPAIAGLDRALEDALSTVRRNVRTFGGAYPDDTTTDDRYPLRPAHKEPGMDDELLAGGAVDLVRTHR